MTADPFGTDSVQDLLLERSRRQSRARLPSSSSSKLTHTFATLLHASQSWLVLSLVGAAIGLNAAIISIVTVWLADLKLGYCRDAWWLNRKFCCWETMEEGLNSVAGGGCTEWHSWTQWAGIQWVVYVSFAVRTSLSRTFTHF